VKTIVNIGTALDSPERLAEAKLNAFGAKLLAESFSQNRTAEATLVIEVGKDTRPVYITLDSRPPEIVNQNNKIWGVFENEEAQEPVASFTAIKDAEAWAGERLVREVDPLHKPHVHVTVMAVIQHQGQVLLVRVNNKPAWAFPEGHLLVGETLDSATRRTCASVLGLQVGRVGVAAHAPYVNVYLPGAQHFMTLCMLVEYKGGEPALCDPVYSEWKWFPIRALPKPLFASAQQFVNLTEKNVDLDDATQDTPPITALGLKAITPPKNDDDDDDEKPEPPRRRSNNGIKKKASRRR
jgi:ADP-ribose pyrophosphatase YjhB (NUDIX family)